MKTDLLLRTGHSRPSFCTLHGTQVLISIVRRRLSWYGRRKSFVGESLLG